MQDYTNLLSLPPDALTSIGVGSLSSAPTVVGPGGFVLGPSSGSIIAITPIPEPATCLLMLMGLGGILLCRKEK